MTRCLLIDVYNQGALPAATWLDGAVVVRVRQRWCADGAWRVGMAGTNIPFTAKFKCESGIPLVTPFLVRRDRRSERQALSRLHTVV